ncbi:hypothetical protein Tco_1161887 [Tanacetum coccineum]
MRIFSTNLIFAFPRKFWSSFRVPSYFEPKLWFFHKVEFVIKPKLFHWKLKFICHWAGPFKDLKWSNVSGVKLSSFSESDDAFSSLQALSDLYYLFGGFMDYLWSHELNISNFGLADRLEASLRVFRWFFHFVHRSRDDMLYSYLIEYPKHSALTESQVVSATNRVSLDPDTSCQNLGRTSNALSIPRRVMTNALTQSGLIRSFRLKASATTFSFLGW